MRLVEIVGVSKRAGFIPYVKHGEPIFYFMVPSDNNEGEPQPAIAKGGIDRGETAQQAALREGSEELGLRTANIVPGTIQQVWEGLVKGKKETYHLTVFIGEVKDQEDFGEPDHEVSERHWLTLDQFKKQGRKSHVSIVRKAASLLAAPTDV